MKFLIQTIFFVLSALYTLRFVQGIERPETVIDQEVGIFTQLGSQVDLNLKFINLKGEKKPLSEHLLPGKPTILIPVYYKCPRLCGLVMDGLLDSLNKINLKLGVDFGVIAVSFNPLDKPEDAKQVGDRALTKLNDVSLGAKESFLFLTGEEIEIRPLMNQVGFKYLKDGDDFAHSAAIMILTPQGKISQYFTGIEFSSWDLRLALIDASMGAVGSAIDHLLLYCFRFDPLQGKYTWAVIGILRIGGVLTLLGLGSIYLFFIVRSKNSVAK